MSHRLWAEAEHSQDERQMPVRFLTSPGGADLDKSRNSLSYPMETKRRIYWKTKSHMAPLYLSQPFFWRRLGFTANLFITQAKCKDESGEKIDSTRVVKEVELPAARVSARAFAPPGYLVHAPVSVAEKRAGTSWIFLP